MSPLARPTARAAWTGCILAATLLGAAFPARAAITVTRTSDSHFYISNNAATNNIRNMYVAYRITNTGPGAESDVWVKLDTFTGGVVSLASAENGLYHIGPLGAAQSAMAYLYLTASATTNTAQTHTVRVYDRRPDLPGAVQLTSSLQTLADVRSSIASNANKVDVLVTGPSPAALGGIVTVTVSGRTGNIGPGDILVFTAASYSNWPADQLELFSASISFHGINGSNCNNTDLGTFTDQLSIPFGTNACYTGVYKLRVRGFTNGPTLASPILHAVSGSQYKHTDPADLAVLTPISITTSNIRLVKTASPNILPTGGNATYTVHAINPASNSGCPAGSPTCNDVQLDDVVDVLPTSPAAGTYVPGSAKLDGVPIPDPVISGATLTWFVNAMVLAGGVRDLAYDVAFPPGPYGIVTNTAVGHVGVSQVDTTSTTGDNFPALAAILVGTLADLAVSKSGPASVPALGSITYTIVTANNGPTAALSVVVRDTLPAGVTFVSADNGGTESGGVVTWPAVAAVPNGGSITRSVTVTAPSIGTLVNVARASSNSGDPDSTNNNGSAAANRVTTTVVPAADLSLAKSGPAAVNALASLSYTIVTTNNGPSPAASVVVRDTLPAGVTFVSADNGGVEAGGIVTWPAAASLANGASLTYSVTVTAPASGTLVNVARADAATADPDTTNNNGAAAANRMTTTVTELADLAVTKTGPATVPSLGSITYTVGTTNNGPSSASSVVVQDTLPAGVTFVSATGGGTEFGGVVTWPAAASLAPGGSLTYSVTVTAPVSGTLVNVARADGATADPDTTNSNGSAAPNRVITTVTEQADLALSKSGPATVPALGSITYTLVTTNAGPATATSVVVQDTLPAGVTFVSADNGGAESGGVVTWPAAPSLAFGGTLTYSVTVTAPAGGTLVNVARADGATSDPDTTNNNGSVAANRVTTVVGEIADLTVSKSGPATVLAGQSLTYTVVTTNEGPSSAISVVVSDTLPAGVTFVSADNGGTESGGVVTWPAVASLANGASLTYSVTVAAPATGTLLNVARADAASTDPDTTNNNGTAAANRVSTTVVELADLALAKSGPANVTSYETFSYTLVTTNNGPSDATSVVVRDTLPAGVTLIFADSGALESGGVVTWPPVSLPNGASLVYGVTVSAPINGTLLNVARADAATADPDTTNNNGTAASNRVSTTVAELADLTVSKNGPDNVNALATIGYTITTTNNGPAGATNVVVRDTLPAGVAFVSADNGGVESGGVVTWPVVASLPIGGSVTYSVNVTAPVTGTLLNLARADATSADPDTANNNGSESISQVVTTVNELANLRVDKSGPATVTAAQNLTYTIVTTNDGPSDASSIVVQDSLPAGVTFVSATNGGVESGGVVTWPTVPSLVNGGSLSYSVTVTAPGAGTLVNVARADGSTSDPDTTNNNGSAASNRVTTTVDEVADLTLAKSGPATVLALGSITYTLVTTNNGPSPASNVVVVDTLPAGVTFVSADNGGVEAGGIVTWPLVPALPSGGSLTYGVTVTAPATGTLVNVARADGTTADPDTTNNNGSAASNRVTTTVDEVADLTVAKSGPATVTALGSISYTLVTTNNGPSAASNVAVVDTLPAGVTFVSADNGGVEAGGIVSWPVVPALASGASLTYGVTVTAPATGTLVNVARADGTTADPDTTNNNGSAASNRTTTTVGEVADLTVAKSGPATVTALGSISYTLVTTNNGPSAASNVAVVDTLPAGVTFVSADNGGVEAGGTVSWPAVPSLASGGSLTYGVTVTAPATGTLVNVARADGTTADPDTTNNNGSATANRVTTTVDEVADLTLAKSGPATVAALGSITYTLVTRNNGPSPASNVAVVDTLPAGVTFVSADNGGVEAGGIVSWPLVASLANGGSLTYGVTVTAPSTGTLVNVARADGTAADPDTTNNNGSAASNRVTTTVDEVADLTVAKAGPAAVTAMGSITYTLVTTNNGPSAASNVAVVDTLPAGVTFVSADNGGTEAGGIVSWPVVPSLANGGSLTYSVTVTAPATGTLVNVARADAATADPDTTNNNGSAAANRVTTVIGDVADLSLAKSGPASVTALGAISYTLVTTNNGPSPASNVAVVDTLPAGVTFVSADNGGVESGGIVTWPAVATLASGGSLTYGVSVTAPASGTLVNVARADATTSDPDTTNNNGSAAANRVTTTVDEVADVVVAKSGPAAVIAMGSISYTIVTTNNGPSPASNVAVVDTLPAGVTFVSADNGGVESGGIVTWPAVATLASGGSLTYGVTVTAPATGTLVNVARADAATADPDTTNNNGSAAANRVTTNVGELADLAVVKSGPATVIPFASITYTLVTTNNGPSSANNVAVVDTLPAGVTFVSADNGGTEAGGIVTWPVVASLASGGSLTYGVTVTAPGAGTLINVARADAATADPDTTNNNGSAAANRVTTSVVPLADLSVAKSGPSTVSALGSITYTLVTTNSGPNPATNVTVVDTLPAGVTFVSADNGGTEAGGIVSWPSAASLANGASLTYTVTVTAPATGTLVNVARADAATSDPDTTNNNGSAAANRVTTTVDEVADVAVAKSGPPIVVGNSTFSYTIVTTNQGPSPASNVAVVDTLPAGVTFVAADNGGVEAGGIVTWPAAASVANGGSLNYSVTVTAPASGTLLNVARADGTTADPDTTNNNGSAAASRVITDIGDLADLTVAKSGPATVSALGSITYTIVTTNNGPSQAISVAVIDTLPAGVTFVSATNGGVEAGGIVTWPANPNLPPGDFITYSVTVTAPATGTLVNVARAEAATVDPDTTNNNGSAAANRVTTTVDEIADLAVVKSGPATVLALGSLTYTIVTTNNGPSPASAVAMTDTLPAGVTFVSATGGGIEAGGIVTWPAAASLASGASLSYSVTVTAPLTGTLINVARADAASADPDSTNNNGSAAANRVTTTVVPSADLTVAKSGPASVAALGSITYTIVTTNNGPTDAANVAVTDTLPAGVTFVSATGGGVEAGGVVTWPTSPLPSGDFLTYSVTVTAPATGTLVNVARADAATADPDTTNNNGSAAANRVTTTVGEIADLAVAKSGPATVAALGSLTYTIVTTNNGPSPASNVAVVDTLPAGVTFVSATGGGIEAGGIVTWPAAASLANGASLSYAVTVTAPLTGTLINVARADAATTDPDASNNDGSAAANRVTTTVVPSADLTVAKSGPASVTALGSITYTIVTTNNGPTDAANVAVTDTLPAGVVFVSADNGGVEAGGVVSWPSVGTLASGASLTYSVTVTAPATGTLVNVAAASASTLDPDATNNDGTSAANRVTTTVGDIADLAVTKTGPASVNALGSITYTLTAFNNGPSPATAVAVTDTLPAGVTFVSATNAGVESGGVVTWPAAASLASGASLVYSVTVTAPATGTLVNVATGSAATPDPDASNNDGSAAASRVSTAIGEVADVAVTKTGPAAVNALASIGYTLTVTNNGPSAASAVVVADTLPAGVAFVSATNGGVLSGNVVTWPAIPSLASGANTQYSVTVTAPTSGTLVNVATSLSATADPDPSNNDGSAAASRVSTAVDAVDLVLDKTHVGRFEVGQTGLYTIVVRNVGTAPASGAIAVTDSLPNGLTFISGSGLNWSFVEAAGVVTATHPGPIPPGGSISFTLTVGVGAAAVPSVTNSATVASAQDPSGSRVSDVPTMVDALATLTADKRAGSDEVEIGGLLDYSISISNQGGSVSDLVVTDVLPVGFAYLSGSARWNGVGITDPAGAPGPQLAFAPGTLAASATGVLTYRVEVGPGATLGEGTNRAVASSALGQATSNATAATVRILGGPFADEGTIAGKIFLDCDCHPDSVQGPEEVGVPGVRVALEDGTAAITDIEGKYHFVGVSPRLHVVRIDRATLPAEVRGVTLTNRHAEDGWSQFVDLKKGELFRADFALRPSPAAQAEVLARRARGEVQDPVWVDPALGSATVTGPAVSAVRTGGYRGMLEEHGWSSAARSLPLAGDTPGLVRLAPPSTTSPGSPNGMPDTLATGVAARVARPSLLALGLLQARLELRDKEDDVRFTNRDRFEDELSDFSIEKNDGKLAAAGRGALFLTGPVARDYRLTVRYDSEHDARQRFFRDIRPDEFYPIYGDASVPEFFAQSRNRVFARLERERSFLQYGDFSTATTNPLRGLGKFDRILNGGLGHVEWSGGAVELFGSRGLSRQVIDEIPALGVSGPYALSRPEGLTNSEHVEIVTRDRNRPSVIVDRREMQRFVDYTIEPFSSRIVFRRAIPSVDENLNPVSIRVSYEADGAGDPVWVYGAQAQVRPSAQIELGANASREEDPTVGDRTIAGANAAVEVLPGVTLLGEYAHSDSAGVEGNAARAELRASRGPIDFNAFGMRTGAQFSNPSSGFTRNRDEFSANGGWKIDESSRLFGEALFSRDRNTGGKRAGGQAGITRRLSDAIVAELAFRAAKESAIPASEGTAATPGASPNETRSLRARLTGQLTPKASVFGEYEQDVSETDQRRAAVGGDLQLLARTRAYLRYEFLSSFAGPYALNGSQERYGVVAGLASEDTRAGTLYSEYRLRDAIDGRTSQAAIGLRNRWTLREGLHLDASAERVSPLKGGGPSQNAAGFGVEYTRPAVWRGTGRIEWRRGAGDDQMYGSLGYAHKLARDWAVLGHAWANVEDRERLHSRTQFGVAWRQTEENRWNGLARLDSRYDRDRDPSGAETRTVVEILSAHANYQPVRPFQLRGQAATRFTDALDTEAGTINASMLGLRATWDLNRVLDAGVIGRTLFTDHLGRRQDGLGAEIGVTAMRNFRLATGYNWFGYEDGGLQGDSRSEAGFYLDLGLKFDEDVFRWLNPPPSTPSGGKP